MNRTWAAALSAAMLVVALAAPTMAAKPVLDLYQEKGRNANAYADECVRGVPDDGDQTCTWSSVWVFDGVSRTNGERSRGPLACVSMGVSVFDSSEERYEDEYRFGCTSDAAVVIAKNLLSASARGDVPTELESCWYDPLTDTGGCSEPVPDAEVAVDVEWLGEPPVSRGSWVSRDRTGDCRSSESSKGTGVLATATGSIDGESVDFIDASIGNGSYRYSFSCHD